ncbi:MAG: hypothetical protein GXO29_05180 [Thermotogae bacterium]|nr:hypothetical protein [Thermotogota bacterium]
MRWLYILSVYTHILMATFWIGGMLFLSFVLLPAIRKPQYLHLYHRLVHETGVNFSRLGWWALSLFFITGLYQLHVRGIEWYDLFKLETYRGPTGRLVALKLTFYTAILILQAFHDFLIGPKATRLGEEAPDSKEYRKYKAYARAVGMTVFFLSLFMALFGVMIVRGGFRV